MTEIVNKEARMNNKRTYNVVALINQNLFIVLSIYYVPDQNLIGLFSNMKTLTKYIVE